jgi:hypothetical protein
MISFRELGHYGRFGNQLFQYAFLRATARRLGVKFFCPEWAGDRIFLLNDGQERAGIPGPTDKEYRQPLGNCGFVDSALRIEDGTDIRGYFQAERYFDRESVTRWYTFKPDAVTAVQGKYRPIDLAQCTGIHLRFGDMKDNPMFVVLPPGYYATALSILPPRKQILVFSDEVPAAKEHLRNIPGNFSYVEGNEDFEDLYLMTRCGDFVCSVSTLSWWGAWLNDGASKRVVAPPAGLRPGSFVRSPDFCCAGWVPLDTNRVILDDYRFLLLKRRLDSWKRRLARARAKGLRGNIRSLKVYIGEKFRR